MPDTEQRARRSDTNQVSEAIDLVKTYVRQNTVDELKPALRFMAFGVPGAVVVSLGGSLMLLGVLRLLQGRHGDRFSRGWSWLPYVITLGVCALAILVAVSLIRRPSLNRRGGSETSTGRVPARVDPARVEKEGRR